MTLMSSGIQVPSTLLCYHVSPPNSPHDLKMVASVPAVTLHPWPEEESDTKEEGKGTRQLSFKEVTSKVSCDTSAYLIGQDLFK